ncbi:MAG: glycosyl hydrolase [Hydrogenophilales bacterium CG_4_10_14_3_um_filter_63_21]|nr:MAG: glycosyl hydrolase [Hydrogenophilales bacterium CG_4_10_14_3_um_filter_63_21]
MSRSVSLLFGVHAHQPIGNFSEVMEDAHQRCYRPFLEIVHRYPDFKFALHSSGWLLEWLFTHHPDDMALLREMAARGQVEFFGAGDLEPVLAVIPTRDRMSQLAAMSDRLEHYFGQRPDGAWLTERVWEATVVPALADSGIKYVMVDDYHFLCAGAEREQLNGYHTTEEDGRQIDVYPISEALRYRLPFSPAHEAVAYIESLADETDSVGNTPAAIYFDDIEKFGIWPETYHWVYERGWLKDFIEGVLAAKAIRSAHFRDHHRETRTHGVVYLPTVSYSEMGEWTLPAPAARRYAELVHAAQHEGVLERDRPYIRGGIWKNFLTRYPEANWAHKRMLGLSARLAALPEEQVRQDLVELLHESQANDAYWHGLFGGIYLPHLRRAVWHAMIQLERRLDALQPRPAVATGDIDLDGREEIFLSSLALQAVVRPDKDAAVIELVSYPLAQNFADTLKRYEEHYHEKARAGAAAIKAHDGEGIASAHDVVRFKHEIKPEDLAPDTRTRGLFAESWTDFGQKLPLEYATTFLQGGAVLCMGQAGETRVAKVYSVRDNLLSVAFKTVGKGRLSTRLNLAFACCDGPAGRYVVKGAEGQPHIPGGFGQCFTWDGLADLGMEDHYQGAAIRLRASVPTRIKAQPHYTVSQSEAGFEKIMQAVELTLTWEVDGPFEVNLQLEMAPLAR